MKRLTALPFLVLALAVACGPGPGSTPPPLTPPPGLGQLQITVSGLQGGQSAPVTITSPVDKGRDVMAPATLNDLRPGTYTISAGDAVGLFTFRPPQPVQTVSVTANQVTRVVIAYQAMTGALKLQFAGLLTGQHPLVAVFGPTHPPFAFKEAQTLPNLEPGDYTFGNAGFAPECRDVDTFACLDYAFSPPDHTTVRPGETAQASLVFTPTSGSLGITLTGLPSGAQARVRVGDVDRLLVSTSSFVNHLAPVSLIKIEGGNVMADDFTYAPVRGEVSVGVVSGTVTSFPYPYTALDGKLRVAISTPPPDAFLPLRVVGPAGFDSRAFTGDATFAHLTPGAYTLTAQSVTVGPGKPGCTIYTPSVRTQTRSVVGGQGVTASVAFAREPCA